MQTKIKVWSLDYFEEYLYRHPASVRRSTFSKDISSEAVRLILSILHTKHLQVGERKVIFYSGRIRTLVALATYSFHRLIMEKVEIDNFCRVIGDIRFFLCPNFEKVGDILVSACPCVCVRMGHRDIVLKLCVWIPHGKIADAYFWFSEISPC